MGGITFLYLGFELLRSKVVAQSELSKGRVNVVAAVVALTLGVNLYYQFVRSKAKAERK